ncbi:MAG: hypothetical protein JXR51_01920 [Bacteroidales bacterium]|nr:hypothetical protein [Bacteroidales bacterium]
MHGPVGGGFCTSCHNPHKSKSKNLLIRQSQQLCIQCHDSVLVFRNKYHLNINITNCTECHDPHGGENRYLAKIASCYKCHENFNNIDEFVHGPVAGGHCTACHSPHIKQTKNLLLFEGQKLCFNCHDEALIFENDYHKNKEINCTECHNPHGGNNKMFIKIK